MSQTRLPRCLGLSHLRFSFTTSLKKIPSPFLYIGRPVEVRVQFQHNQRGSFSGRLELTFQDAAGTFIITRPLRAVVSNLADHDFLKPSAPYVKRKRTPWEKRGDFAVGQRPPAMDYAPNWVRKLPESPIPQGLSEVLRKGSSAEVVDEVRRRFLPETVGVKTHGTHFRTLLWVEEERLV